MPEVIKENKNVFKAKNTGHTRQVNDFSKLLSP